MLRLSCYLKIDFQSRVFLHERNPFSEMIKRQAMADEAVDAHFAAIE